MTPQKTQEYLKAALDLEMSVYKQTQTRKEALNALVKKEIIKNTPKKPEGFNEKEPLKPEVDQKSANKTFNFLIGFGIFCLISFIPMGMLSVAGGFFYFICGIFCIYLGYHLKTKKATETATYEYNLKKYKENKKKHEETYAKQLEEWKIKEAEAEKNYQTEKARADKSFYNAKKQVNLLDAPLEETQKLLEALYAKDIIFEKYRNLVAISTIYEYFASGRCTELTGANGAYNLFETELRQNLIINQLEQVNANLEEIKANQYILYQGISKINNSLDGLAYEIKNIAQSTKEIAVSSRITAICSEVTAQNTLAANYIAILD